MRRNTLIAAGLFLAWLANDIEETVTMQADSRRIFSRMPAVLPIPAEVRRSGVSQSHIMTGISMMGGLMAAASIDGIRSQGRSRFFQSVLLGFGLHGFGHLATAAATRHWSSGSLTSPTIVIPYWLWASRELRRDGVDPRAGVSWPMIAATPAIMVGVHALAWGVRRLAGVRRPLLDD